ELVDEDDCRGDLPRAIEQPGDLLFALAVPFAEQVRRFGGDEIGFALARRGLGQQGLAGARRPIQQKALRRTNTEALECLRVLERQFDTLAQSVARVVEPADVVPADDWRLD